MSSPVAGTLSLVIQFACLPDDRTNIQARSGTWESRCLVG